MFRRGFHTLIAVLFLASIAAASPIRVLVMPFEPIGPSASQNDLGEGLSATIASELSADKRFLPFEPSNFMPDQQHLGIAGAQAIGQASNAAFVVFGSYQQYDGQLRITGYVVNVATGEIAGTLRSTGDQSIWFSMQDSITSQVRRALPRPEPKAGTETALPPVNPIAYSGPLRGAPATTHTPEIWQPKNAQQRFPNEYDRYYRRPGPYYPFYGGWYGWGWGRGWSGWSGYRFYRPNRPYVYWANYWR